MTETKIYVGLNDRTTLEQRFETEKYVKILKEVCKSYHTAFSFSVSQGGYFHENGEYTQENTLVLSLVDADPVIIEEISKDLCAFFHQESVMVTEAPVSMRFVKETL